MGRVSTITLRTAGQGFTDITAEVAEAVRSAGVSQGLASVFLQHTSASLVVQENADETVRRDLEAWMAKAAPESGRYEHDSEGPDDMPSHIRAALTGVSVSVPVVNGKLALGRWQAIYLWEHRRNPHTRSVVVHVG